VETVLRGQDPHSILLVIRFRLFEDEAWAESILRDRWEPWFGGLLIRHGASREVTDTFSLDEKLQQILRRPPTIDPHSTWEWNPSSSAHGKDPDRIANDVSQETWLLFRQIFFGDSVGKAISCSADSLEAFFFKLTTLSYRLFL